MLPYLSDLTDTNIHLADVSHSWLKNFLGLHLLWLLLLFRLIINRLLRCRFFLLLRLFGLFRLNFSLLRLVKLFLSLFLTTFLCGFFILNSLQLGQLLQLGFRGAFCVFVWKRCEELLGVDLLEHARQMLHVVNPTEGVGKNDFLVVSQRAKVFCDVGENYDVGGCDTKTIEEQSVLANVRVDKLSQLNRRKPLSLLNK